MKRMFWTGCLSTALVLTPLMAVSPVEVLAADPVNFAQSGGATYDQWMRLGYRASRQRNYSDALFYFQKALQKRPGDRYATVAIRNVTSYLARLARNRRVGRPQISRQRRSPIAFLPANLGAPRRRVAGGTRGTQSNQSLPVLTLIVPNYQDGLTTSDYPTFFWHVSAPAPMTFVLTEAGATQPLLEKQIQPQTGIIQLEMPKDLPELVPGREYRWSVTLTYNPDRPSANPFIQSWIERVPPRAELTQQLAAATLDHDRALIYAQAGLWYDAFAAISTAYTADPSDQSILADRLLLLDQVGLKQVSTQERQRLGLVPEGQKLNQ